MSTSRRQRAALILLILIGIVFLAMPTRHANADAGGFPTSTPTQTQPPPTPTVTSTAVVEATSIFLPFPPTSTFTPAANIVITVQPQSLLGNSIPQGPSSTQAPARAFSFLTCVPFALIAIVLAIGLLWFLRNRVSESTP